MVFIVSFKGTRYIEYIIDGNLIDERGMTMETTIQDFKLTTLVISSVFIILFLVVSAVEQFSNFERILDCITLRCDLYRYTVDCMDTRIYLENRTLLDLTGGLTFLVVVIFSLWSGSQFESPSLREIIVSALVVVWSLRLSSFLYFRIHRTGKDGRFDRIKTSPIRFLVPWTLQGLWVFLTMVVVIVINNQENASPALGIWDCIGFLLWITGFGIEVIADNQAILIQ